MTSSPISEWPTRLRLGYHTVKRMQPRQVGGMGLRTLRELLLPRLPVDFDGRYERRVPDDPSVQLTPIAENTATLRACLDETTGDRYRTRAREAADGAPTFLNRTLRVVDGATVDWYDDRFDELPLLWALKLYAFQPLSWTCLGVDPDETVAVELRSVFDRWIRDWIESIEIGRPGYLRRAWTPWAVSLRILHWCRYLAWRKAVDVGSDHERFERAFRRELYKNVLFLRNHVERDVGGNHLIENGAALAVAGLLFAERSWVDAGVSILTDAAADQFLDDGCHFERSPMYHVLSLTRYLSVCDLLDRSGRTPPERIRSTATDSTAFLRFLRPPDGRLPLLNDAVHGQGLSLDDCLRYADALGFGGGGLPDSISPGGDAPTGEGSGYHWLEIDDGAMLVDGGPVGPPHLPGHSHSDTLGVLLWLDGLPVVTDSGTFGYVSGPRRMYARGVEGHNTVQVADTEPIAIGGKYLMGPRPEPTTRFEDGPVSLFEGRYEAAPFDGPTYTHHRAIYAGDRWWAVWDTVWGHEWLPVRSRLHLHPDVGTSTTQDGPVRLDIAEDQVAFISPLGRTQTGITSGWYFPRFGVATRRPVVELQRDTSRGSSVTLGYLVTERGDDVEVTSDGVGSRELSISGNRHRLPATKLMSRTIT